MKYCDFFKKGVSKEIYNANSSDNNSLVLHILHAYRIIPHNNLMR